MLPISKPYLVTAFAVYLFVLGLISVPLPHKSPPFSSARIAAKHPQSDWLSRNYV